MADVSVQNKRINGWIPSSATNVIMNWPERIKTQPHDDRDNCFQHFDSKGPCGMTLNNDIDDDSATKHGDPHTDLDHDLDQGIASLVGLNIKLDVDDSDLFIIGTRDSIVCRAQHQIGCNAPWRHADDFISGHIFSQKIGAFVVCSIKFDAMHDDFMSSAQI